MSGRLALFDLDNTLLGGDSDHAWGEFLIAREMVDAASHRAENDRFYQQYKEGVLDIHGYVRFTLSPVLNLTDAERDSLHGEFVAQYVRPLVLPQAMTLVKQHQDAGDCCVIITATNDFITTPIAAIFGVEHLIATELEREGETYTGNIAGIPCYQQGKISKLESWLANRGAGFSLNDSIFYSDSINDLPLLECVQEPIVVDPDVQLRAAAEAKGWNIISLRS